MELHPRLCLPQIRRLVLDGQRPEVPPQHELPGPDTARWEGLPDYLQLMRCAALLVNAFVERLLPLAVPHVTGPFCPPCRRDCWAQEPHARPPFSQVVARLGALLAQSAADLPAPAGSGPSSYA